MTSFESLRQRSLMQKLRHRTDSPRTLIVAPVAIYPADEGNRVRISRLASLMDEMGHETWFLGLGLLEPEVKSMQAVWGDRFFHGPKLRKWRIRPLHSAIWRTALLLPQYFELVCPPIDYWYQPQWDALIRELQREVQFNHVIVSYVFFSRVFNNFDGNVLKILDTHDVFTNRDIALRAGGANRRWFRARRLGERKGLLRSDCVLAIQHKEAAFFRELIGHERPVHVVGHIVSTLPEPMPCIPMSAGFIGSANPVNVCALEWFLDNCWPDIRCNVPDAQLLVCGGVCEAIDLARSKCGVTRGGKIIETSEFYRNVGVVINPCTVGTGLKIKSIEALGFGKMLVCLPEGASGLDESANAFVVARDAHSFSSAVIKGLKDSIFAAKMGERALAYAREWNAAQKCTLRDIFADRVRREKCNVA
jgi:hypothetical protein